MAEDKENVGARRAGLRARVPLGTNKTVEPSAGGGDAPIKPAAAPAMRLLNFGESANGFFMLDAASPHHAARAALVAELEARPSEPGAWGAVVRHIASFSGARGTPHGRLKLYRRATQLIPRTSPETLECEAYIELWIDYALLQAEISGEPSDALDTFKFMAIEHIGTRAASLYSAWARCEANLGHRERPGQRRAAARADRRARE